MIARLLEAVDHKNFASEILHHMWKDYLDSNKAAQDEILNSSILRKITNPELQDLFTKTKFLAGCLNPKPANLNSKFLKNKVPNAALWLVTKIFPNLLKQKDSRGWLPLHLAVHDQIRKDTAL